MANEITYDPSRPHGISAFQEIARRFAVGDPLQFTAPNRTLGIANRDLGTIERIDDSRFVVRMDTGKSLEFDAPEMRHFDHGYAATSHSSQELTADRVLVHLDTDLNPKLINSRFAYVSLSRASQDAQIFTNSRISISRTSRSLN